MWIFMRLLILKLLSINTQLNQYFTIKPHHFIKIHLSLNISSHYYHSYMHPHPPLRRLLQQDSPHNYHQQEPTTQELYHALQIIAKEMKGRDLFCIFRKLSSIIEQCSYEQTNSRPTDDCGTRVAKEEQEELKQEMYGFSMPAFEIRQIMPKVRIKQSKQKTQERDWLKNASDSSKKDGLDESVWKRYVDEGQSDIVSKASSSNKALHAGQNEQNIKKIDFWDMKSANKQFRLIANKTAPRFNSKEQEMKYYEKRQAAKLFSDKQNQSRSHSKSIDALSLSSNYGLKTESRSKSKGFQQKRRDKNVKNSFIVQAFRKYENFIMEYIDKRIRPITGSQMRVLYPVLLKAPEILSPDEYHTFRKFVKYCFDLGSVSLFEKPVRGLFRTIHYELKQKLGQYNSKVQSKSVLFESGRNWNMKCDSVSMIGQDQYEQFEKSGIKMKQNERDDYHIHF